MHFVLYMVHFEIKGVCEKFEEIQEGLSFYGFLESSFETVFVCGSFTYKVVGVSLKAEMRQKEGTNEKDFQPLLMFSLALVEIVVHTQ